jgi:D-3-phosphoglycerate dehydrogenase
MMRILITEDLPERAVRLLQDEGWTVDFLKHLGGRRLADVLEDYDAVIVRSGTRLTADLLQRARRLRVIGRPGAGVDNIDVEAATRQGIVVMNTPGQNSVAAAEHTLALILCALRHVYAACASLKARRWERVPFVGRELAGKVVGLYGLGRVGRELARRLRAFQARVQAYDPYVPLAIARELDVQMVDFDTLVRTSDILSLHAPLTEETRGVFHRDVFRAMKPGVIFVNCARGELVREADLLEALDEGRVAAAALDVFAQEPPQDWRLIDHPRVIATPHLGGSTVEAHEKVGYDIAVQVRDYLKYGIIRNAVNFPSVPESAQAFIQDYMRLGYALGQVAVQVADFRPRRAHVEYWGRVAREETRPVLAAVVAGLLRPVMGAGVNWVNAVALAEDRGLEVTEIRQMTPRLYESLLRIHLADEDGVVTVEGTVIQPGVLRLVALWDATVDVPIQPYLLVVRNRDVPGAIGAMGQCLGQHGINIAYFGLARLESRGEAVGVIVVDEPVPEPVMAALRGLPMVLWASFVRVELTPPAGAPEEEE